MTFTGFEHPKQHWSKLPHAFINALNKITSLAELKVILYILRHTWGFQEFDKPKRITLDEFQNGRKRRDGSRLDAGVGMSKNAIKNGLERAVTGGFIIQTSDGRDAARNSHEYQLVMASTSDTRVSEVDTLPSEIDTRSEKDTPERYKERHVASDAPDKHLTGKTSPQEKKGEPAMVEYFGPRPERQEVKPSTPFREVMAEPFAEWGNTSAEFQRQLVRYGVRGRRVQELGWNLEQKFGIRPLWSKPRLVSGWMSGLSDCLELAENDTKLVLDVARGMREENLTIKNPYSLHGMINDAMAKKRSGESGTFGVLQV